jgi:hypothetical protein
MLIISLLLWKFCKPHNRNHSSVSAITTKAYLQAQSCYNFCNMHMFTLYLCGISEWGLMFLVLCCGRQYQQKVQLMAQWYNA